MTSREDQNPIEQLDVLIVGSGFGGCYLLHLLRDKLNLNASLVDAGTSFGGVWN